MITVSIQIAVPETDISDVFFSLELAKSCEFRDAYRRMNHSWCTTIRVPVPDVRWVMFKELNASDDCITTWYPAIGVFTRGVNKRDQSPEATIKSWKN